MRFAAAVVFIAVLVWLMSALESVTTMIMVAFFFAYLLNPPVNRLEAWGAPRSVAALALLLGATFAVVLVFLFLVPSAVEEVSKFVANAPAYFATLKSHLLRLLERYGIDLPRNWDQVYPLILEEARSWLPSIHKVADPLGQVFKTIFQSALNLISAMIHLILIPVLVYYFLVSFNKIEERVKELIPPYMRDGVLEKLREMDRVLSGFVRGQLVICLILAALYSLGFVIIGLELAIVIGTLSGLLFIIPYLGTMIGIIGGSILALAQFGDLAHVLYVVGWIVLVQLLESYVLTPKIVGEATGLHPVVYILALIVGAHLFGFVGMLVAIPVTAVLKVLLKSAIDLYRKSDIYQDRELGSGKA